MVFPQLTLRQVFIEHLLQYGVFLDIRNTCKLKIIRVAHCPQEVGGTKIWVSRLLRLYASLHYAVHSKGQKRLDRADRIWVAGRGRAVQWLKLRIPRQRAMFHLWLGN